MLGYQYELRVIPDPNRLFRPVSAILSHCNGDSPQDHGRDAQQLDQEDPLAKQDALSRQNPV